MISSKGPRYIERNILLDHVVAGPGQLVGDRLEGHDTLRPGLLALVIATDRRVVPDREVRRLNERPAQERVAILRVPRSFALPIGPVRTPDQAGVRNVMAHFVEPADIARL